MYWSKMFPMWRNAAAEVLKPNGLHSDGFFPTPSGFFALVFVKENPYIYIWCDVWWFDVGPHLSGLSEAHTESIIPTSSVPWGDTQRDGGRFTNSFQGVDNEFDLRCTVETNYLTRKQQGLHSQVQHWRSTWHFQHICVLLLQNKALQQNLKLKEENKGGLGLG